MYDFGLLRRTIFSLSLIICLIGLLIKTGSTSYGGFGGGYGGGYGGGLGLGYLSLLGAANLTALCILRGGTCTAPGACITNLHRGLYGYGHGTYNQFLCNETTICCLPYQVVTIKKVIYPSRRRYGRRRYGYRRGYGSRHRSGGYGSRW